MAALEITIQRKLADYYPIVATYSDTDALLTERSEGELKLTQSRADQLFSLLGQPKDYGVCLGEWLFEGDIGRAFAKAKSKNPECLRLLLFVEAEDALKQLRWERLCARGDGGWNFLRRDQRVPYSLYIPSVTDRLFPPIGRYNLKTLVLAASPEGSDRFNLASFDVEKTVMGVRTALGAEAQCDVLAPRNVEGAIGLPTFDNLIQQLTEKSYTFLHIVCHGRQRDDIVLFLENEQGQVEPVSGKEFIRQLKNIQGPKGLPHFAFLCTCESAKTEDDGAFGGFAGQLVRDLGMPAVVAMTEKVSVRTAESLASAFYKQLVDHGQVDLALDRATAEVSSRDDVLVPALFSRLGERPLFSDDIPRPLESDEIAHGLDALQTLLPERAPVLMETVEQHKQALEKTRGTALTALEDVARKERQRVLDEINEICGEVLDLSFKALTLGTTKVPDYDARCPFRGLYPFRLEDREFFYGREKLVKELQDALDDDPLLGVLGGSGSGKSSLVLAGLLPALQKVHPELELAYMTPGDDPLKRLESSLLKTTQGQPYILVVDQFEELFTLCDDDKERADFVQELLNLVSPQQKVVFTVRDEWWGECLKYEKLSQNWKRINPMSIAELRTSMEQQANKVGLRFDVGLSNTILDSVEAEPGVMPLLQHALRELWERRHGRWLLNSEYRNFGGIKEAIAITADNVYKQLSDDERSLMQNIFVRLTRLDSESQSKDSIRDTRRRVTLEELIPTRGNLKDTKELVTRLSGEGARLIITRENTNNQTTEVEVAHEALISYWPKLRKWLEDNRENYESRADIRQDLRQWKKGGCRADDLITSGRQLGVAEGLLRLALLNEEEKDYVDKSLSRQRKREKMISRIAMAVATILFALSGISLFLWQSAKRSRKQAIQSEKVVNLKAQSARASSWVSTGKSAEGLMLSLSTLSESIDGNESLLKDRPDSLDVIVDAQRSIGNAVQHAREENFLLGHEKDVRSIAYDPNNDYIVSGGLDKSLSVWNATTGDRIAIKEDAHYSSIYAVAISPNGKYIASSGNDGLIRIWSLNKSAGDAISLSPKSSRQGHGRSSVRDIAFSPDGSRLVSASDDKTLRLWDVKTGNPIGPPMMGHTSSVWTVAYSPNSRYIASGSVDRSIKLWDAKTGKLKGSISRAHADSIFSVAFSSDSQKLVSGSADRHIRLWNVNTEKPIGFPLIGHDGKVYSAIFSADDQTIISTGSDRTIQFWHAKTYAPIGKISEAHSNLIWDLALGDEGEKLISASSDTSVRLWDMGNDLPGKPYRTSHTKSILATAVNHPNGNYVLTAGEDRRLSLWGANEKQLIWQFPESHTAPIQAVAFRPRKEQFVTGSSDGTLKLWETRTGKVIWKTKPSAATHETELDIYSVAFSPDGRFVVSGGRDGKLRWWNARTGKQLYEWVAHPKEDGDKKTTAIFSVAFSPDGRYIASASADDSIKVWDVRTRRPKQTLNGHDKDVWSIAFSPDSKHLVSGSLDKTVRMWDAETGKQLGMPLKEHTNSVFSVAFSPDGEKIASGSLDKTIRLWTFSPKDRDNPVRLDGPPLVGHTESVWSVQFMANGKSIVSGSADLSLRWWPSDWDKWAEMACERLQYHPRLAEPEKIEDIDAELQKKLKKVAAECQEILGGD